MSDTTAEIQRLLDPILRSRGLSLWDLEFKKEGPRWLLRIYIDRDVPGASLNDCEAVSRELSAVLDVEEAIQHAYTLEVSTPGLDRTLTRPEHFRKSAGFPIKIKTYQPVDGQKVFAGILAGFEDGVITLELEQGKRMTFPLDAIAKAAREVVF